MDGAVKQEQGRCATVYTDIDLSWYNPAQIDKPDMDDATHSKASQASDLDAAVTADTAIVDAAVFKFGLPPKADDALRERLMRYTIQPYRQIN